MAKKKAARKESTAAKSSKGAINGGRHHGFKPGQSGNPNGRKKGVKNKATIAAKEAASRIIDDPAYIKKLHERALAGRLPPAVETMLWHYSKGKPKEVLEVSSSGEVTHKLGDDANEALARYASVLTEIAQGSSRGSTGKICDQESVDS